MVAFLTAAFFSVLSNCICVFFVNKHLILLENKQTIMDIFLHNNIICMFLFIILFNIQKLRGKVHFKTIDTFRGRQNIIQFLLFIFPVIAAIFKTFMLGFIPVTTITISSLIVPFAVCFLAVFLLKEKFNSAYVKYGVLALFGFVLVNLQKLSGGGFSLGFLHILLFYILLESIGQITLRYYCRKRSYGTQAVLAEITIFFVYGGMFIMLRGTFGLNILLNPYVWVVSLCCFMRHVLLINGVRRASSIVALEFCAFAKPIFAAVIMFLLVGELPSLLKVVGSVIIAFAIVKFHALEREAKKNRKAIGQKLFDEKTIQNIKENNELQNTTTSKLS